MDPDYRIIDVARGPVGLAHSPSRLGAARWR